MLMGEGSHDRQPDRIPAHPDARDDVHGIGDGRREVEDTQLATPVASSGASSAWARSMPASSGRTREAEVRAGGQLVFDDLGLIVNAAMAGWRIAT